MLLGWPFWLIYYIFSYDNDDDDDLRRLNQNNGGLYDADDYNTWDN